MHELLGERQAEARAGQLMFGAPLSGYPIGATRSALARLGSSLDATTVLSSADILTAFLSTDLSVVSSASSPDQKVARDLSRSLDVVSSASSPSTPILRAIASAIDADSFVGSSSESALVLDLMRISATLRTPVLSATIH
jgi:hypothetical protein